MRRFGLHRRKPLGEFVTFPGVVFSELHFRQTLNAPHYQSTASPACCSLLSSMRWRYSTISITPKARGDDCPPALQTAFDEAEWATFMAMLPGWEKELRLAGFDAIYNTLVACGMDALKTPGMATALLKHFEEAAAAPPYDSTSFNAMEYVSDCINSNAKSFVERDEIVKRVKDEANDVVSRPKGKPVALTVFSPRGTGKTSLVRRLALDTFGDAMKCGRVLVADCARLDLSPENHIYGEEQVKALIIHHLLKVFGGSTVTLATSGKRVSFPKKGTFHEAYSLFDTNPPKYHPSLDAVGTVAEAISFWKEVTASAFALQNTDPELVFLFDSVEVFCEPIGSGQHWVSNA